MKITRDVEYRDRLLTTQRLRMGVGGRRSGVHVSDLILCLRKAWAERETEHVPDISDNTVLTWLRGLSHEYLLTDGVEQVRAGYCFPCQRTWSYTPELSATDACPVCGDSLLTGTIDWVTLEGDDGVEITDFIPVEAKSTMKSSRRTLEDGEMAWYVDQIKTYMWMHKREYGRIVILHVSGDYSPINRDLRSEGPQCELVVYGIEWESDEERDGWGDTMGERKRVLEGSVLPPATPIHPYICDYCIIGELLPDGTQCELFPWTADGTRKGSKSAIKMTMDEMNAELDAMIKGASND